MGSFERNVNCENKKIEGLFSVIWYSILLVVKFINEQILRIQIKGIFVFWFYYTYGPPSCEF